MAQILDMPQLSDTMKIGVLQKWRKNEGDKVSPGEVMAEIETDKAVMSYAGRQSCAECHDPIIQERKGSKHEQVGCESCHGPLSSHTSGDVVSPPKPDTKSVCVPCHTKMDGRPAKFPQLDFKDHAGDALCVDCHKPHSPKIPQ